MKWNQKFKNGDLCRITYKPNSHRPYRFKGDTDFGEGRKYDVMIVASGWEMIDGGIRKSKYGGKHIALLDWTPSDQIRIMKSKSPQRTYQYFKNHDKKLIQIRGAHVDFVYSLDDAKNRVLHMFGELCTITKTDYNYDSIPKIPTPDHILVNVAFLDKILSHPLLKNIRDEYYWECYARTKKRNKYKWAKIFDVDCGTITKWGNKYRVKMGMDSSISLEQMEQMLQERVAENPNHWNQYMEKLQELKKNEELSV